jgi:hypothetical protein
VSRPSGCSPMPSGQVECRLPAKPAFGKVVVSLATSYRYCQPEINMIKLFLKAIMLFKVTSNLFSATG